MTEKAYVAIAIDGPAAAGKTTQAKILAKTLGYTYVDTGAIYRGFALHKIWLEKESGKKISCETALRTLDFEFARDKEGNQRVIIWGEDVTDYLRTPEVSMEASITSANPSVRAALLKFQTDQAAKGNVVMEGRDIGTVVLPDAHHKFFLTADPLVRAYRRRKELAKAGRNVDPATLVKDIMERDYNDSHREAAPLKKAKDAYVVDCSDLTIEQTTQTLLAMIQLNGLPEA